MLVLVLGTRHSKIVRNVGLAASMEGAEASMNDPYPLDPYPLDHERLDVYRLAVQFAAWVGELIDDGPLKVKGRKISAVKHLDDSSRSIVNNIAEGNGKRSLPDRCRFLDISRGSALECGSCLDILVARKRLGADEAAVGKAMVVR